MDDKTDFVNQLNTLDKSNNILQQIPKYNTEETNYFISNLEEEYEQQKTLNTILNSKNFDKECDLMKNFINNKTPVINKQFNKLINVSENLKKIVLQNKKLMEDKNTLEDIINSDNYKELANKLKLIKKEKESIKLFLQKNDIISLI